MESLKKDRKQLRRLFSIAYDNLSQVLSDSKSELQDINNSFKLFSDKAERLFACDERIKEKYYETENEEEDESTIEKEYDQIETYKEKWITTKTKYEDLLRKEDKISCPPSVIYENINNKGLKTLKLPKLELKTFDGELKNWIGFWGQFKRIHEDQSIEPEDKFQYLIQATLPGSSARELVESFPPSAQNYPKVIERLKMRFARDELLIETYVRELLNLVLRKSRGNENKTLRDLYDKLETQLRALESLGVTADKYAAMLYPLVESALPDEILKVWERLRRSETVDKSTQTDYLTALLNFLKSEVESEERLLIAKSSFGFENVSHSDVRKGKIPTAAVIYAGYDKKKKEITCIWCDKNTHSSQDCYSLKNFDLMKRKEILTKKGACFKCLKKFHTSKVCKAPIKCLICFKGHNVLLCSKLDPSNNENVEENKTKKCENDEKTESLISHERCETLLQTLIVKVAASDGTFKLGRVLIDSGSQRSYITKEALNKLGLKSFRKETLTHNLFGGIKTKQKVHNVFKIDLMNMNETHRCTVTVLDQEKICNFIPRLKTLDNYPVLKQKDIQLTDVGYNVPEVKILLGADIIGHILTENVVKLDEDLIALETKLGWTVMGQSRAVSNFNTINTICCLNGFDIPDLWRLEAIGIKDSPDVKSKEDRAYEVIQFFENNVKINEEKRYEVRLPFKEDHPQLMSNKEVAEKRLLIVTKKLKEAKKYEVYDSVFSEWLKLGIIETVPENDEERGHYLPHRAVVKEASSTTKVRPVFDASALDGKGHSLNNCLEKGPNLIEDLPKILIQFRKRVIGVVSDIKKAFLQISIDERDRNFLRFLWWKDTKLITFRHRRVVFGITSSPFLLSATINHHLRNCPMEMRATAEKLLKSFYVDNCISSVQTEEELKTFTKEAEHLMSLGKFELHPWVSNPVTPNYENYLENEKVHVLGLLWNIETDELSCDVILSRLMSEPTTKRSLLSVAQKIFDPLGFTCPATLLPKLLLQETWTQKYKWDEELPDHITKRFEVWLAEVHWLNSCSVPRRLTPNMPRSSEISLHMFCDASKVAYAACIFLRACHENEVSVQLVQAKARIAPIKQITTPRLELLSAVIGVRLFSYVSEALQIKDCKTYFWSDSAVVLTWIKRHDNWNTFVSNRCEEIRRRSDPAEWRHIPGVLNPADLPSRGCSPKTLVDTAWWKGPEWLSKVPNEWPHSEVEVPEEEVNEERKKSVVVATDTQDINKFTDKLSHFSSYTKTVRMIGWIFRFYHNIFPSGQEIKGELSNDEVVKSEKILLRLVQKENLCINDLKKKMQIFEDSDGLLKIKTKLLYGEETEEFKKPILLLSNHPVVLRLIEEEHRQSLHAGLRTLLTRLREKYWILGIRRTAKRIVSKCVVCRRHRIASCEVPFAPLPKDRIGNTNVFEITGVDYAGPLILKSQEKAWVALFTCAVYRTVHFELVSSLSTSDFIQALRRFIARRGRVSKIYSDNGTNFTGTNNALLALDWDEITAFSTTKQISWKFIPPTAAWWGGWWERLVRMLKELLRRVLGQSCVDYQEMYTVLCDCEAVVNSRPLTYLDDNSEELMPLTPATFLHAISNSETPDLDHVDRETLVGRAKYLQKLREDLRQRFRNEYLALLVHQGQRKSIDLQVGDVVLLGDDRVKRVNWPLGVILEIYPGADSVNRVAKVRTCNGEKIRPFQRLYPLEVSTYEGNVLKKPPKTNKRVDAKVQSEPVKTRSGRIVKVPERLDL